MAKRTIIVVEDDPLTARLVAEVIETLGHVVESTATVDHAFRLAEACQPAVMLVDVQLGTESGLDLMSRLASDPKTMAIPIIAMTALDGTQYGTALERAGAIALLEKPFSAADVVALVDAVIDAGPK
ncbi:MAG: response regulator [Alphaproteobacteria bacterium]|nr:response regulator [Alphaproteobacteria bacterium]